MGKLVTTSFLNFNWLLWFQTQESVNCHLSYSLCMEFRNIQSWAKCHKFDSWTISPCFVLHLLLSSIWVQPSCKNIVVTAHKWTIYIKQFWNPYFSNDPEIHKLPLIENNVICLIISQFIFSKRSMALHFSKNS